MRFLLELVPCCGSPIPAWRKDAGFNTHHHHHESEEDEDARSLVPPTTTLPLRLRKRVRTVVWSPSLGSIWEDRASVGAQRMVDVSSGSVREGTGRMSEGGSRVAGHAIAPKRDRRPRDRDEPDSGSSSYLSAMMISAFAVRVLSSNRVQR